jgi:hypothetical protein
MTKRHSKGLSFFSAPGELKPILESVLSKTGTRLCRAVEREGRWFFREVESPEVSKNGVPQFYPCHPAMIKECGLDSLANIVQVWFPVRVEGDLRMGEVGMLVADSELDSKMRELQGEIYRALRKELTGRFKKGVWGRNSNTHGEYFYKDILISKDMENAARAGLVLSPQLGDGFVTFSPDRAQ